MENLFRYEFTIFVGLVALVISLWQISKVNIQFRAVKVLFVIIVGLGFMLSVMWAYYLTNNIKIIEQNIFSVYHYIVISTMGLSVVGFGFVMLLFSDMKR